MITPNVKDIPIFVNKVLKPVRIQCYLSVSGDSPYPNGYKKDVGVILLLIPSSGLGCHSIRTSNAASPRQG